MSTSMSIGVGGSLAGLLYWSRIGVSQSDTLSNSLISNLFCSDAASFSNAAVSDDCGRSVDCW